MRAKTDHFIMRNFATLRKRCRLRKKSLQDDVKYAHRCAKRQFSLIVWYLHKLLYTFLLYKTTDTHIEKRFLHNMQNIFKFHTECGAQLTKKTNNNTQWDLIFEYISKILYF